ncbi:hypothetical protein CABS02_14612 [Colletotrichum abscissum]|uniref:Uncharacterized protein n=1 Tax=Colletotrichum abscissum TaxID=1671311 RepID=A0A9P9X0Y3_9PEZI|nr:hypothetical protein CABS02_14612 [Colletotrichum abscissum]
MAYAELSPERIPYYLSDDNTDPSLNVAYLKDAYDLLHHTLKNEPRAKGRVVGYDITDMHPPMDKLPDNLTIAIGDDERVWRKGTPYDIIHARVVESIVDWQDFPKIAYNNLNPGGCLIIEMVDLMPCGDEQKSLSSRLGSQGLGREVPSVR